VAGEIDGLVDSVLSEAGLDRGKLDMSAATGSGAEVVTGVDMTEDEVTCVAAAGAYLLPDINMVVDVGGQSIASMMLDEDGDVVNYMRNDKCASGSGRFLEVMSNAVGVSIDDIDRIAASSRKVVQISSQCGVFAESEVISHVNDGEEPPDIVAGLCDAVASIVASQARRFSSGDKYTLTGGVARIQSVAERVHEKLEGTFYEFPHDPRLATAIGAAVLASLEEE
jgi:predicted CoA-substrate-specific enzyme activase